MRKLLASGLVVVAVLLVFFVVVWVGIEPNVDEPRRDRAKLDLSNICAGLELHRAKMHAYPKSIRGMVDSGVLEKTPRDPWGNDYVYALGANGPELWSYGSDGAPGGDGSAADLHEICSKPQMRSTE